MARRRLMDYPGHSGHIPGPYDYGPYGGYLTGPFDPGYGGMVKSAAAISSHIDEYVQTPLGGGGPNTELQNAANQIMEHAMAIHGAAKRVKKHVKGGGY